MPTVDLPSGWVVLLGAVHGINPAMGWLFAVSLGLQAGDGRAVWQALGPLALGHALAVAAAVLAAAALGIVLPLEWLRWIAAGALLGFGAFHLLRHRHPRGAGMCVGVKELAIWSFLMASAHGAGLMVLPFVLGVSAAHEHDPHSHASHLALAGLPDATYAGVLATMVHTASYLLVAGAIAWVVYEKLGLRLLRRAWINLNLVWAIALIVTAVITPLL